MFCSLWFVGGLSKPSLMPTSLSARERDEQRDGNIQKTPGVGGGKILYYNMKLQDEKGSFHLDTNLDFFPLSLSISVGGIGFCIPIHPKEAQVKRKEGTPHHITPPHHKKMSGGDLFVFLLVVFLILWAASAYDNHNWYYVRYPRNVVVVRETNQNHRSASV